MKQSTYDQLKNYKLPDNISYGNLFEKSKLKALTFIDDLVKNGIPLDNINFNDYTNESFIKVIVDINGILHYIHDFTKESLDWLISLKDQNKKVVVVDPVDESKFKSLIDCYRLDTIKKAISESKYINFQTKRTILRSINNKNYSLLFENLELLPIFESKTFSESDINSLLSDYFGEATNLSINSKMITDFNDRYGLMIKNSGKYETEDMNLLLDEWFNYWSQNGLISKSDTDKAEDRKLDNKESEVPNDIKNFFRAAGYKYVGHNQKFKVYTYSIGLGKDDPNFITATLDLTDKTLRLLNLNQKDVVQSADNLSSIKLPTTLDEFNTLLAPDTKEKETTSESKDSWNIEPIYNTMEYFDGEDIYQLLVDNGYDESKYLITIFNNTVDDFNRKLQEFKVKLTNEEALVATLDYLKTTWFKDILEKTEQESTEITEIETTINGLSESEIQDAYLYLYMKDKPYDDSMKQDLIAYFKENPDDKQSMNYISNLVNA